MKQELEQLDYEDMLVQMNSCFEQYGVRSVLSDFRNAFPKMFTELVVQLDRLKPGSRPVAALLKA